LYRGDINHDKIYEYQQATACAKEKGTKKLYIKTEHRGMVINYRN